MPKRHSPFWIFWSVYCLNPLLRSFSTNQRAIALFDAFILQIHSIKRMLWYHLAQFGPESGYIFLNVPPVTGVFQRKTGLVAPIKQF